MTHWYGDQDSGPFGRKGAWKTLVFALAFCYTGLGTELGYPYVKINNVILIFRRLKVQHPTIDWILYCHPLMAHFVKICEYNFDGEYPSDHTPVYMLLK